MVNYVEIALILVVAWSLVLSIDFLQSKDVGPLGFQKSARRIFHSYWPGLLIYQTLLIVSYGLWFYYCFTDGAPYLLLHALFEGPIAFVSLVVFVWGIVRDWTDEKAVIKREIANGLRVADSLEQYLEPILERISANPESEHSKHTLSVLGGMVSVCDSRGAAIGKLLEKCRL
jgi:hypothetical protein